MPIYEYHCPNCQHHFEKIQRASDPMQTDCPNCPSKKAARVISAASFHLKGTGWYATDFKDKSPTKTEQPPTKQPDKKNTDN